MKKIRLDQYLLENDYFQDEKEAQGYIIDGRIFIDEIKVIKPGEIIIPDKVKSVRIKKKKNSDFVSRGGLKLLKALEYWEIDVKDKVALDVGSSTGGFVDCLLQHGAKQVTALDVGTNQLEYSLRINPQVEVFEQTNFRTIDKDFFDKKFDLITMDVSFISITILLDNIKNNLKEDGKFICLVKPQFEADRHDVSENGIIMDPFIHQKVIDKVQKSITENGLRLIDMIDSPITGTKGNREFLFLVVHDQKANNK